MSSPVGATRAGHPTGRTEPSDGLRPVQLTVDQLRRWIEVEFCRSAGPGGQNVNKVSTRVILRFDLHDCADIPPEGRLRIARRLASRIDRDGRIRISSQRHRTQSANRRAAEERLIELLTDALLPTKVRHATKPTAGSRRRRRAEKVRRSRVLSQRRGFADAGE